MDDVREEVDGVPRLFAAGLWDRSIGARLVYFHLFPHETIRSGTSLTLNLNGIRARGNASETYTARGQYLQFFSIAENDAQTLNRVLRPYLQATITTPNGESYHGVMAIYNSASTRATSTVLAAEAAADTAGGISVTLPADYATYHDLSIAGWETADDAMFAHDIPTDLLAVQTQTRTLTIAGNPGAAGAASATWDPSTRLLAAVQSRNAPWRIIKAELHD